MSNFKFKKRKELIKESFTFPLMLKSGICENIMEIASSSPSFGWFKDEIEYVFGDIVEFGDGYFWLNPLKVTINTESFNKVLNPTHIRVPIGSQTFFFKIETILENSGRYTRVNYIHGENVKMTTVPNNDLLYIEGKSIPIELLD